MIRYLARRIATVIPLLLAASFCSFVLMSLAPGDPARAVLGLEASLEDIERFRQNHHLDEPAILQYLHWLGGALRLDLGTSWFSGQPIVSELSGRLMVSIELLILATALSLCIALPLGLLAGVRPRSFADIMITAGTGLSLAIPSFVVGIILVLIFGLGLRWFPFSGYVPWSSSPGLWLSHMLLPALALASHMGGVVTRQLRAAVLDTMGNNYIRAAWARGGRAVSVLGAHALRNASLPALTVLGVQIATLLGGAVLVEQIFAIPGIGPYLLRAILAGDIPVVQAVMVSFVVIQLLISLIVDIVYGFLNPKLRVS